MVHILSTGADFEADGAYALAIRRSVQNVARHFQTLTIISIMNLNYEFPIN